MTRSEFSIGSKFPNYDVAEKCYNSKEYQEALSFLNDKVAERIILTVM